MVVDKFTMFNATNILKMFKKQYLKAIFNLF